MMRVIGKILNILQEIAQQAKKKFNENLLLVLALFVVGCAEDKYEEFYKAVEGTQKGQESVWLEVDAIEELTKHSYSLVYDNMLACEETAEMYEERYGRNYRCQRVQIEK